MKKFNVIWVSLQQRFTDTIDAGEKYFQEPALVSSSGCNDFTSILQSMLLDQKIEQHFSHFH